MCGEYGLIYEGMLVWRSGPRPPRKLARKQVGFSPRADYERERLYHCDRCGTKFYQDMEQKSIHLYAETEIGHFVFDHSRQAWEATGRPSASRS